MSGRVGRMRAGGDGSAEGEEHGPEEDVGEDGVAIEDAREENLRGRGGEEFVRLEGGLHEQRAGDHGRKGQVEGGAILAG